MAKDKKHQQAGAQSLRRNILLVFGPISTSDLRGHFDDKFAVLSSKVVVTH